MDSKINNKLNKKEILTEEIYNSDIVPKLMNINGSNYPYVNREIIKYIKANNINPQRLTRFIERDIRIYKAMDNEWIWRLLEELLKESKGNGGDGNVK